MRSPHASTLHPKWGVDLEWMRRIGVVEVPVSAGSVVIEPHVPKPITTPLPLIESKVKRCKFLGKRVARSGGNCWKNDTFHCKAGKGDVVHNKQCKDCNEYQAK